MDYILSTSNYRQFTASNGTNEWTTDDISKVGKCLNGDIVDLVDNDSIKLIKRHNYGKLVGILHTNSKIKYGINSKGNNLYIFTPFAKEFPQFIVCSSIRDYNTSYYVVIDFLEWTSKYPRGNLIHIIGETGTLVNNIDALHRHYSPNPYIFKKYKDYIIPLIEKSDKYNKCSVIKLATKTQRVPVLDYTVNIDPNGCTDIDDCFSFNTTNESLVVLNIHIADVSAWVTKGDYFDKIAEQNVETLYSSNNHKLPMLPNELSESICSLIPGTPKLTISLFVTVDLNTMTIVSNKIEKTVISNNASYNYDNYLDESHINWTKLYQMIHILRDNLNLDLSIPNDSHMLVETMMIYYNNWVGNYLDNGIYRCQLESSADVSSIPTDIQFLWMERADYTLIKNKSHTSLGLTNYTHATSPIRRYVDLMVQRLIFNNEQITTDINYINNRKQFIKKFYRDLLFIESIYKPKRELDVIVLEQLNNNKYSIYIPEWKQILKIRINNMITLYSKITLQYYVDLNQSFWKNKIVFKL